MCYQLGIIIVLLLICIYYDQFLIKNYLKSLHTTYNFDEFELAIALTNEFGLPEYIGSKLYWLNVKPDYNKLILLDKSGNDKKIVVYMPIELFKDYKNINITPEAYRLKIAELVKYTHGGYDSAGRNLIYNAADTADIQIKTQYIKLTSNCLNKN